MEISEYRGPPIFPTIRMSERFRSRYQGEVESWIANCNSDNRSFASKFGDVTVELKEKELGVNSDVYGFHLNVRLASLRDKNQGILPDISVCGERHFEGKIRAYKMHVSKFVFSAGQMPEDTEHDLMLEKLVHF